MRRGLSARGIEIMKGFNVTDMAVAEEKEILEMLEVERMASVDKREEIDQLRSKEEKKGSSKKRWDPGVGGRFYFEDAGKVYEGKFDPDIDYHVDLLNDGNCYKSRGEAEFSLIDGETLVFEGSIDCPTGKVQSEIDRMMGSYIFEAPTNNGPDLTVDYSFERENVLGFLKVDPLRKSDEGRKLFNYQNELTKKKGSMDIPCDNPFYKTSSSGGLKPPMSSLYIMTAAGSYN